jgi:hypothetical protein
MQGVTSLVIPFAFFRAVPESHQTFRWISWRAVLQAKPARLCLLTWIFATPDIPGRSTPLALATGIVAT